MVPKEAVSSRWQLAQRLTTGQCAKNKRLHCKAIHGRAISRLAPSRLRISEKVEMERRQISEVVDAFKNTVFFRHNREDVHKSP